MNVRRFKVCSERNTVSVMAIATARLGTTALPIGYISAVRMAVVWTRYLVDTASEPRREARKYDSEERLNRIMEEMSNAPLYDLGFIALDADDTSVKSVAEGDGFTYTVLFDGRSSLYTYRVEDKKRDESISVTFTSVLSFGFSNLIEALGLADE